MSNSCLSQIGRYRARRSVRRRLLRLVALSIVLPAAVEGAGLVADRLEATRGPSTATRSLRRAAGLAARHNRRRR